MARILLTGGNGFIGRNIREQMDVEAPSMEELNLLDEESIKRYFSNKYFDVVLHAANIGSTRKGADTPNLSDSNIKIFENIISKKSHFGRMINFGSGAEYDKSKDIVSAKEEDAGGAKDEYGAYKFKCSQFAESVDYITHIRLFGVYGKYEDYTTRLISNLICRKIFDIPLTINQDLLFDYLYVDDLVKILKMMIDKKPRHSIYNVCSGMKVSLAQIGEKIGNVQVKIEGLGKEYTGSNDRLRQEYSTNFTDIDSGIKSLFSYYESIKDKIKHSELLYD
jgi:GDP-L-fucose synthase